MPESDRDKSAADDSSSRAHGKFRLEPLEPRVLLSGDSVVAVVAYQALLQAQTNDGSDGPTAIVEQLDDSTNSESRSADRGGNSTAANNAGPTVSWPESWQVKAADKQESEPDSAAAGGLDALVSRLENSDSADSQLIQLAAAQSDIAPQNAGVSDTYSSPVEAGGEAIIAASLMLTPPATGPPEIGRASCRERVSPRV